MKNKKTILLHNITPDEFKDSIISELKEIILDLLAETKKEKPVKNLTRQEAAKILRVSVVTMHQWDKLGIVQPYRIGNCIRYKSNEIEDSLSKIRYRYQRNN